MLIRRLLPLIIVCLLTPVALGQDVVLETPTLALRGIPFDITVRGGDQSPDSLQFLVDETTYPLAPGDDDTLIASGIVMDSTNLGAVRLMQGDSELAREDLHIVPGWISILPPLLAILIAIITRNVVPALFLGIWFGAFTLNGFSVSGAFTALLDAFQVYILNALADSDHAAIILFSLMIGGMVGIITENGGMRGVVRAIERFTTTRRTGQTSTGVLGLLIFFDDYANSLVVGGTMRHVTDRLKVSREKLAYIVDSTAAPVSCIAFVTTWIGFEVGLIGDTVATIDGFDESGYSVFLSSIPFSFYPWLAILFVFVIALSGRDFGPMLKAERRAHTTGRLWAEDAKIGDDSDMQSAGENVPQRAINAVLPVLVLVIGVIVGLFATGTDGTGNQSIRDIIGNADSYRALMWASLLGALTAAVLTLGQGILSLGNTVDAWYRGGRAMGFAMVILVMAWALSAIAGEVHTADYLVSTLGESLPAGIIPALVFILAAAVAFATGTSWGTMGILIPLVLPLAWAVLSRDGADPTGGGGSTSGGMHIMYSTVACVLGGAVWGDHCSPISDTTILSSMASGCDHIDHVRTQMPYALLVGGVGLLIGTIPVGFGLPWWIAMALAVAGLIVVHRFIARPVEGA